MNRIEPVVCLITDFGLVDAYVAEMKGVMLQVHPDIRFVDITHDVATGDVKSAAYILKRTFNSMPCNCVYLAVVDPGVGSERQAVALDCMGNYFIGPDNGVFSYIVDLGKLRVRSITFKDLENPSMRSVSFHGRDLFAPIAARLAKGDNFDMIGEKTVLKNTFPPPKYKTESNFLFGEVVYIDKFGNISTNIPNEVSGTLRLNEHGDIRKADYYSQPADGELIWIAGSDGSIEIACKNRSAAKIVNATLGDEVTLQVL